MVQVNLKDYFIFYELSPSFQIDSSLLKRKYIEYSKQFHPDLHLDDIQMQTELMQLSAYNNKAYKTLKEDISRAQSLVDIMHPSNSNHAIQLPQDFLIEMMDFNELIDEQAIEKTDSFGSLINTCLELKGQIKTEIIENATQEHWMALQISLLKWRYIERLEFRIYALN